MYQSNIGHDLIFSKGENAKSSAVAIYHELSKYGSLNTLGKSE